ncbi:MAG: radical SAM family heme chaperone HemW [Proteobacteria bacterium]|nr:radical SAM family heme chaperone HemW [Pseudomonadota bacterium]
MLSAPPPIGVYLHWPYCARICPYCDFNVRRDRGQVEEQASLVRAMVADLENQARLTGPRPLVSVFLGGGTPSLMRPEWAAELVETARRLWTPAARLEVTLEANPTDAEAERFKAFAAAGVNRLSLGVQSLDDAELQFLGRNHDAGAARRAVALGHAAFPRLSVDLIYALPGQTPQLWGARLEAALAELAPEHVSAYQLGVEPGTAFHRAVGRGIWSPADPDRAADLYQLTQDRLGRSGFDAYEISNHARGEAARSRHNLVYWRGEDYAAAGPGAHARLTVEGVRHSGMGRRRPADYLRSVGESGSGFEALEALDARDTALERLILGLRTVEGAPLDELSRLPLNAGALRGLSRRRLVQVRDGRLTATPRGRLVLDRLCAELAA